MPGQLLCKMLATVAELEAVLIRLRSREGMKVARAKVNVGQSLVSDARLAAEPSVSLSSSAGTEHR